MQEGSHERARGGATSSQAQRMATTALRGTPHAAAPATIEAAAQSATPQGAPATMGGVQPGLGASSALPQPPRLPRPPRISRAAPGTGPQQVALDFSAIAPAAPIAPPRPAYVPPAHVPPAHVPPYVPAPALPVRQEEPRPILPVRPGMTTGSGMAGAMVMPGLQVGPYLPPQTSTMPDPDVWLIALATPAGGQRFLEGADRPGAIRVSRPYGHLRALRPVLPPEVLAAGATGPTGASGPIGTATTTGAMGASGALNARTGSGRRRSHGLGSSLLATDESAARLPAERPLPAIISAVEVETDAGVFRVERPHGVLGHSDLAWALANLEAGEPDSLVPLPRRQLALLLTLLPTPEDPEHPEQDSVWGWAHRLKSPWERGPLHPRGRLGRLIAIDPDLSHRGMHRACFEVLGTEEIVWALGVPCYRTGSVYELVPLRRSRWLTWPLAKVRSRAGATEKPDWEIARVVFRVGAPRWPLAGVVEPLGPLGVAG